MDKKNGGVGAKSGLKVRTAVKAGGVFRNHNRRVLST
jgi:hypothetical protein